MTMSKREKQNVEYLETLINDLRDELTTVRGVNAPEARVFQHSMLTGDDHPLMEAQPVTFRITTPARTSDRRGQTRTTRLRAHHQGNCVYIQCDSLKVRIEPAAANAFYIYVEE